MSDPTDVQNSIERMMSRMDLRGLRPNTVSTFAGCARRLLAQVGKPPSVVTAADVETFLLDLCRKGSTPSTRNVNLAAVRCLLGSTTGSDVTANIPRAKVPRRSPKILSGSEVVRLLAATDSPKYLAIFNLAYGAGLRLGEITALEVEDIDSQRMLIHVRDGKTGDRHVILSPRVLEALRSYWKAERPKGPKLFPGRSRSATAGLSRTAIHHVITKVARKAGIKKRVHLHLLRHCFASASGERSPLSVSASHGPATTCDQSGSVVAAAKSLVASAPASMRMATVGGAGSNGSDGISGTWGWCSRRRDGWGGRVGRVGDFLETSPGCLVPEDCPWLARFTVVGATGVLGLAVIFHLQFPSPASAVIRRCHSLRRTVWRSWHRPATPCPR